MLSETWFQTRSLKCHFSTENYHRQDTIRTQGSLASHHSHVKRLWHSDKNTTSIPPHRHSDDASFPLQKQPFQIGHSEFHQHFHRRNHSILTGSAQYSIRTRTHHIWKARKVANALGHHYHVMQTTYVVKIMISNPLPETSLFHRK
jgi:hypothetical protein